jgi:ferredoxin-thioredoxin reductase catalytic subunit
MVSVLTVSQKEKNIEDTKLFAKMTAKHQGWELNHDKELTELLFEGLTTNWNRYGYLACPCRLADGVREEDKDIICPCEYAKPDLEEYGHCYCGLYLTKEFFASGKQFNYIPDRRP